MLLPTLQVLAIMLAAAAMAPALAHALELPGKMRLRRDIYYAVQEIYYPGFAIGGLSEPVAIVATVVLMIPTPAATAAFWLSAGALVALLAMHATYWLVTHPVNNFWVEGMQLSRAGAGFFGFDPLGRAGRSDALSGMPEWTALRDRWEYSHVVRAAFGLIGLALLAAAATA